MTSFKMRWPVEKNAITQRFGERPEVYKQFGMPGHEGLDFGVVENSKIFAVADGVVTRIDLDGNTDKFKKPYGNQCRIVHKTPDGEFTSIYAHLNSVNVSLGQKVQAGDLIALSGKTGNSEGAHLHLTLKLVGATSRRQTNFPNDIIDPFPFLEPFGTKHAPNPVMLPPVPPVIPPVETKTINVDLGGNSGGVRGAASNPPTPPVPPAPAKPPVPPVIAPDALRFIADVNIPDNTVMRPGQTFTKTWRVRNAGNTSWSPGFTLAHFQDARLGAPENVPLTLARAGDTVEVSVTFTAPTTPGTYRSIWKARNNNGQFFGAVVFVVIVVR
jgi:hypothetical protein